MTSIVLSHVDKSYGNRQVLSDISLTLSTGKHAITGANGTGKSVLMRLICGLEQPTAGKITGVPEQINIVSDSVVLPPSLLPQAVLELYDDYARCDIALRDTLIEEFEFSEHLYTAVKKLSTGNLQKLKIILALSGNGRWLFLDEPFNGLDSKTTDKLVEKIAQSKKSIVLIDHQQVCDASDFNVIATSELNSCTA